MSSIASSRLNKRYSAHLMEEMPSSEDLVKALIFSVGLLEKSSKELNPQAIELLKKCIFSRYLDCVQAGLQKEANMVVAEEDLEVPLQALVGP